MQQVITKYATVNKKVLTPESGTTSSSPSGSPRSPVASTSSASVATVATKSELKLSRTLSESSDHGEVDMDIIKAPVVAKGNILCRAGSESLNSHSITISDLVHYKVTNVTYLKKKV